MRKKKELLCINWLGMYERGQLQAPAQYHGRGVGPLHCGCQFGVDVRWLDWWRWGSFVFPVQERRLPHRLLKGVGKLVPPYGLFWHISLAGCSISGSWGHVTMRERGQLEVLGSSSAMDIHICLTRNAMYTITLSLYYHYTVIPHIPLCNGVLSTKNANVSRRHALSCLPSLLFSAGRL